MHSVMECPAIDLDPTLGMSKWSAPSVVEMLNLVNFVSNLRYSETNVKEPH